MKLRLITLAVGLAATASAVAAPATDAQVNQLQTQLQRLQSQVSALQSGNKAPAANAGDMSAFIGTYAPLTWQMMSYYSPVGREMYLLQARKSGKIGNSAVYLGGFMKADALWQVSNQSSNFQFRNPVFTTSGTSNKNASGIQFTNANLLATVNLNQWATGYVQLGNQFIGETSTFDGGNNVTFQQAYLLLGDLNQMPVYGFIGQKDIDFGHFASVNMYTQPLNRMMFAGSGNTAGVGYNAYGANVVLSAINGGLENNARNVYTSNNATLNNFALNASYGGNIKGADWNVGAGYLQGANIEFARNSGLQTNGAWDLNGQLSFMNFDLMAEYTATTSPTNTTIFSQNENIAAWNVGLAYNFPVMGRDSKVSFGYSQAKGMATKDLTQYVVGFRHQVWPNVWAGLEYSYNKGILIADNNDTISSSNQGPYFTFPNPDVNQNTILLDLTAAF